MTADISLSAVEDGLAKIKKAGYAVRQRGFWSAWGSSLDAYIPLFQGEPQNVPFFPKTRSLLGRMVPSLPFRWEVDPRYACRLEGRMSLGLFIRAERRVAAPPPLFDGTRGIEETFARCHLALTYPNEQGVNIAHRGGFSSDLEAYAALPVDSQSLWRAFALAQSLPLLVPHSLRDCLSFSGELASALNQVYKERLVYSFAPDLFPANEKGLVRLANGMALSDAQREPFEAVCSRLRETKATGEQGERLSRPLQILGSVFGTGTPLFK